VAWNSFIRDLCISKQDTNRYISIFWIISEHRHCHQGRYKVFLILRKSEVMLCDSSFDILYILVIKFYFINYKRLLT